MRKYSVMAGILASVMILSSCGLFIDVSTGSVPGSASQGLPEGPSEFSPVTWPEELLPPSSEEIPAVSSDESSADFEEDSAVSSEVTAESSSEPSSEEPSEAVSSDESSIEPVSSVPSVPQPEVHPMLKLSSVSPEYAKMLTAPDPGQIPEPEMVPVPKREEHHQAAPFPTEKPVREEEKVDSRSDRYIERVYEDGSVLEFKEGSWSTLREKNRVTSYNAEVPVSFDIYQTDEEGREIELQYSCYRDELIMYTVTINKDDYYALLHYNPDGSLSSARYTLRDTDLYKLISCSGDGSWGISTRSDDSEPWESWSCGQSGYSYTVNICSGESKRRTQVEIYWDKDRSLTQRDVWEFGDDGKLMRVIGYREDNTISGISLHNYNGEEQTDVWYYSSGIIMAINEYCPQGKPRRMRDYDEAGHLISEEIYGDNYSSVKTYYNPDGTVKEVVEQ